jgi:glycosyltransferase involved in cell wall biosynthesis
LKNVPDEGSGIKMKTPRRRDGGVSLGRFINFKNPPLPPFYKVGLEETPQQRLWGIENLMKKISVLTLISMNPNKLGALEEYALHLSKELIRRGHFAAVGFSEYPPDWLMQKFNTSGIEVLRFSPSNGAITFITHLRKVIQKYNLNIVHATFYPFYSLKLITATIGNNCKLIFSDQESRISHTSRGLKSIFRFLRNRLYQKYIHAIIADAEFIRKCQIQDHFTKPDKVSVIYNGVNLQRFKINLAHKSDILKKFSIPPNSSVIVTIAQCIPEKGLNYLIDAAKMVIEEHANTFFIIVGNGPERTVLERQTVSLGIQDNVIFTGMRVDTEVFLSVADVFVLLSVWEEAFAFSLLEAMASGCPVVASRIGAIPESQDGMTGILVPPHDAKSAAEAILSLLNNDTLRSNMGFAARQRVENYFSLDHWINQTINLYEKALEDPNP